MTTKFTAHSQGNCSLLTRLFPLEKHLKEGNRHREATIELLCPGQLWPAFEAYRRACKATQPASSIQKVPQSSIHKLAPQIEAGTSPWHMNSTICRFPPPIERIAIRSRGRRWLLTENSGAHFDSPSPEPLAFNFAPALAPAFPPLPFPPPFSSFFLSFSSRLPPRPPSLFFASRYASCSFT